MKIKQGVLGKQQGYVGEALSRTELSKEVEIAGTL